MEINMQRAGAAQRRRSWPKFGDAVNEDVGARATKVSPAEIFLERPGPPGNTKVPGGLLSDTKVPGGDLLSKFRVTSDTLCWTCGRKGDHLTFNCHYRDIALAPERYKDPAIPPESYRDPAALPEGYSLYDWLIFLS